ncbi:MAG: DoxX family protein [Phycisphaerales bacterium]|nr:DoxX family protein [Phycisphaerales bacterium]
MSHPVPDYEARPAALPKRSFFNTALWVLQILVALAFLAAGTMKLMGGQEVVAMFDKLGLGQWFRYVTGGMEVLGGLLLLVPSLCGVGALLLVCVMIGAITAHLTKLGGSPMAAIILLCITGVIALGRAGRTMRLLRK